MAVTITVNESGAKVTPLLVLGYESARASRHVIHEILGTGNIDATLRPSPTRSGTLSCLFDQENASYDFERACGLGVTFTLTDPDRTTIGMRFIPAGTVTRRLDDSRSLWIVDVPYREFA